MDKRKLTGAPLKTISLLLLISLTFLSCKSDIIESSINPNSSQQLSSVDSSRCIECHKEQYHDWSSSDHYHSMQLPKDEFIQAPFKGEKFEAKDKKSYSFIREKNQYYFKIDGKKYLVKNTFGHNPLQQYLLDFGNGKFQIPSIAWDTKNKKWFDVNKDFGHDDYKQFHWKNFTGNWNQRCANCHSSGFEKNFDFKSGHYNSKYQEVNVSCQSCHGKASGHIAWTKKPSDDINKGFGISQDFKVRPYINPKDELKKANTLDGNDFQNRCFKCHSLRSNFAVTADEQLDYLKNFAPRVINEQLYEVDGQVKEEAFVMGSFTQSKMYHKGVSCLNCHNPHSGKLVKKGNGLCLHCHTADYNETSHSKHQVSSASCVDCHMPKKSFMVVDDRADHQFHIPRPDHSLKYGVKNSCTKCHGDYSKLELSNKFKKKFPKLRTSNKHLEIISLLNNTEISGLGPIKKFIENKNNTDMKKAHMISKLSQFNNLDKDWLIGIYKQSGALVKSAIIELVINRQDRAAYESFLVSVVKEKKGWSYSALYNIALTVSLEKYPSLKTQLNDYINILIKHADMPDNIVKLASLSSRGHFSTNAKQLLETAVERTPYFFVSYVNLADMYRAMGQDEQGLVIINKGLDKAPRNGSLLAARGLSLIRKKNYQEALLSFKSAADNESENAYFQYLYLATLESIKGSKSSFEELKKIIANHYNSPLLLQYGAQQAMNNGDRAMAKELSDKMQVYLKPWPVK